MVAGGPSEASDHRNKIATDFTTPEGVADQIQDAVNSLRDRFRGRQIACVRVSGGRSLALGPPADME
jgi:hypothetical protein